MIEPVKLKKNDLQPYYYAKAVDSYGNAISLSGASIVCTMLEIGGTSPKINRRSNGINVSNAAAGEFEFHWVEGDTDTVGAYAIEFEITPGDGGKFTVPVDELAQVVIYSSLDERA